LCTILYLSFAVNIMLCYNRGTGFSPNFSPNQSVFPLISIGYEFTLKSESTRKYGALLRLIFVYFWLVRGSNPLTQTNKKTLKTQRFQGFSLF